MASRRWKTARLRFRSHTDYDIGGVKWQDADAVAAGRPAERGPLRRGSIVVVTSSSKSIILEDGRSRIGEWPRNWSAARFFPAERSITLTPTRPTIAHQTSRSYRIRNIYVSI